MGNVLSVIPFVAVPLAAGAGIGAAIAPEIKGWYKTVKKPSWNPPNWVFGPAWTVLYTMMGVASWRVWRAGGGALPLGLYGAQLVLNLAWSPIFFGLHNPGAASVEITGLLGVLAATIYEFNKVDATAALLMAPYAGWTTFAAALTYTIYGLNKGGGGGGKAPVKPSKLEQVPEPPKYE